MNVIPYQEKYHQAFVDLNTAWVEKFFVMEQEDREILAHTEDYLRRGGMIFFAVEGEEVLATCMVYPTSGTVWELCKLAAAGQYTGTGAGSAVFQACMEYAIEHGAEKLTLISNHMLEPALHIYEKFGFRRVPVDRGGEYERCDVQCEYLVPKAVCAEGQMQTEEEYSK